MTWEYLTLYCENEKVKRINPFDNAGGWDDVNVHIILDRAGAEDWELVDVNSEGTRYIFKRAKQ